MRKLKYLPVLLLAGFISYVVFAEVMSWHVRTFMQIQYKSQDSLLVGKDKSDYMNDSVTIAGRIVAPPRVTINGIPRALLRGSNSWVCYMQDTSNALWGGMVVRQASRYTAVFIENADSGWVISLNGQVQEYGGTNFPVSGSGWLTQVQIDTNSGPVNFISTSGSRPTPKLVYITEFGTGDYPNGGTINFVTGEKYEGMYVEIRNVFVGTGLSNRQPWSVVDSNGNKLYMRDFSNFFSTSPTDTLRQWTHPATGTFVNYIRGVIINANNEGAFGTALPYAIVPIYPNDLSLGLVPPSMSGPTKSPGVPTPADSVTVSVNVTSPSPITNVSVLWRVNGGPFNIKNMSLVTGNLYAGKIPPYPLNTLIEYFMKATNSVGMTTLLPADTSRSKLFYVVKASDSLSIQEVQYCPNNGGRSGYENAFVRGIEGIVTADTTDFYEYSCTSCPGGPVTSPRRVIIQNGTGPFSGIWITGTPTDGIQKGQRVRVRGIVTYSFGVNTIAVASVNDVNIISSGNPLPAPEILTASVLGNHKSGGDTTIKKWESVLVKINTPIVISCINAARGTACTTHEPLQDTVFRRNFGEFLAYDYTGVSTRIMLPGCKTTYTNFWDGVLTGKNLLTKNDSITSIQGILYYAYTNYKICPRTNADFGTWKPVGVKNITNVVKSYQLNQNYPNPFNPVTRISYSIPAYSKVTIKVYDILGRQIRQLVNENMNAGTYLIDFNGSELASGVYFIRMTAEGRDGTSFADTKKMLLVK